MLINSLATGVLRAHCYIVEGDYSGDDFVLVIDPGGSIDRILKQLKKPVTHIALTHAHFDHVGALKALHEAYPEAKICVGEFEDTSVECIRRITKLAIGDFYFEKIGFDEDLYTLPKTDILLKDGDDFLGFKVIHTPGHTKGSICLYHEEEKVLFSGDTLFYNSYGRTDLEGNEYDLVKSLDRLMQLDSDTQVYPGHNETTTIGREKTNLGY